MKLSTLAEQRRLEAEQLHLTKLHGPPPVCCFKTYRLHSGLSLQALVTATHLSKNAIVRAENGTYTNPLPSLVSFWERKLGLSESEITDAYCEFQYYQRLRHFHYFGINLQNGYNTFVNVHPFRQLRKQRIAYHDLEIIPTGLDPVSRALCIPIDTLRYWEKKFRQQQTVPKLVIGVLLRIGYTQSEVQQFCRDYGDWRRENLTVNEQAAGDLNERSQP